MAENKKSIIEEALLDITKIQEALNSNTKEILRSVAKEEIDQLVRESINEDDYEEEDVNDTESDDLDLADAGEETGEETGDDFGAEESGEEEGDEDLGDDYEGGETEMDDMEGGETNYDEMGSEDDYEMDMTGASDEDVIAVYKKLSGDDEIEVVSDNEVHIKDPVSGAEYQVKLGGGETEMDDMEGDLEMYGSDSIDGEEDMEETVYEIALDDEEVSEQEITEDKVRTATSDIHMGKDGKAPNTGDIEGQKAPVGNENDDNWAGDNLEGGFDDEGQNGTGDAHGDHVMEGEISEEDELEGDEIEENLGATRGYAGRQGAKMNGAAHHPSAKNESVESKEKYNALLVEAAKLKQQNDEFRVMLNKFRKMLGETVVFNTNLTNVTRLFTEHSTTRDEKEAIIKRFDEEVTTIKESKKLYKIIENELSSKKPISESIERKMNKEVNSAQSTTQLNESTAYVDSSTQRIKDLISRVERPRD
jgi:hypothetical protein